MPPLWIVVALGLLILGTAVTLYFVIRMLQLRRRDQAIQLFLDSADALEADLQACKARMEEVQDWIRKLAIAPTPAQLIDPAEAVQTALKHVLNQRLWLRDVVDSATVDEIKAACGNFERSRENLAQQLLRLDEMKVELEQANETVLNLERSNGIPIEELSAHVRRGDGAQA